jgi:dTMP kinase
LVERLRARGVSCRLVREPGGTAAGERIRKVVLDPGLSISREAELLLILAARAEFVREVVKPALERGEVVVADRYELSTFAYQGFARGMDEVWVRRLNDFATGGLKPDAVLLLAVDPDEGLRRKKGQADRMEREGSDFHRRVAEGYERLARSESGIMVVDTGGPVTEVEVRILRLLADRWPETFGQEAGLRNPAVEHEGELGREAGDRGGSAEDRSVRGAQDVTRTEDA